MSTKTNEDFETVISNLRSEIINLKKELKTKVKYGLVFERKSEKVVDDCENKLPVLKEVVGKKIETDKTKPTNIIIEGDNYHSLQVLNYTHQGKIDVIYIDPPYNTGNKDFIYNDSFVDKEDSFRHSKWLSFMEKRLLLARDLLSESGVIFISIDDNEQAQLKLLCDAVFGENNFISQLPRSTTNKGKNDEKKIASSHDYVILYGKIEALNRNNDFKSLYRYKLEDNRGKYYVEATLDSVSLPYSKNLDFEIKLNGKKFTPIIYNGNKTSWRWSKDLVDFGINNNLIIDKKGRLYTKTYLDYEIVKDDNSYSLERKEQGGTYRSQMFIDYQYSNNEASRSLKELDISFDYSKPVELLKKIIQLIPNNEKSIILDFMAGSGTTGHAVLELNKEDGGNRQFILCTNNGDEKSEHKIASDICYPRVQKVIEGYVNKKGEKVAGLGGNLRYMKTTLIDKKKNKDEMKFKITQASTEILCLKEGVFEIVEEVGDEYNPVYAIVRGADINGGKVMGIYLDIDNRKLEEMRKKLLKYDMQKVAYIFTLNDESLEVEHNDWLNIKIEPIPEKILNAYQYAYKLIKK